MPGASASSLASKSLTWLGPEITLNLTDTCAFRVKQHVRHHNACWLQNLWCCSLAHCPMQPCQPPTLCQSGLCCMQIRENSQQSDEEGDERRQDRKRKDVRPCADCPAVLCCPALLKQSSTECPAHRANRVEQGTLHQPLELQG